MSSRIKKILLLAVAVGLLFGTSRIQKSMNVDRERLGLTRTEVLENAPPVLAFTTVALGGFRGLISNALWMRAGNLQEQDKFFEAAQLADWITKLEPHFPQVWVHEAWNMSYNISVKFKNPQERWNWVQRGIELLRDEGLKYNPNDVLIYQQLAWHFQHKLGANLDDASQYYKAQWSQEMTEVLGRKPNLEEMINPKTNDEKNRAKILKERYKMDPAFMKEIDEQHGPLDWRLPEAHAIYWAEKGLHAAAENPEKIKKDDLLQLRRVVYQSMQISVLRGRLVEGVFSNVFELSPNLDIIRKTSDAYELAIKEEPRDAVNIGRAHRNLIRQAIYFLYEYDRIPEAAEWFKYLAEKYPNDNLITGKEYTKPGSMTLDQYAYARAQEDIGETSPERIKAYIEGRLRGAYLSILAGQDKRANGYRNIAQKVWELYQKDVPKERYDVLAMPPFNQLQQSALEGLLDPTTGLVPELRASLRHHLGMPPEELPAPGTTAPLSTDAPPAVTLTNSPPHAH